VTRIDFYHDADDRLAVACRLVAKAVQQKHRVLIYAPDGERAQAIDQMLWSLPQTGFIPHCMTGHKLATETPVLIARDAQTHAHDDVLVNLHDECPPDFARFGRLLEIVGREDADKQWARARFKFYKDRGYPMQAHSLSEAKI
jgi:DNA polymerase III subunit chi